MVKGKQLATAALKMHANHCHAPGCAPASFCDACTACRQEASAAGTNLRSDVERLQARLAGESACIEGLRQGVAAAAQQEAAALAGLQGQVG
jgi:hypothetical protein